MKKIFPILIVFLFMFSLIVSAGPAPPYIFQTVITSDGVPLDDIVVTINNMDYEPDLTDSFITERSGRAIFSLSEEGAPYTPLSYEYNARGDYGDRIGVRVCQEGTGEHCYTSYEIGKECPVDVSCLVKIDLKAGAIVTDKDGVERKSDDYKTKYQCWDGSMVWNEDDCPEQPEEEPEPQSWEWYYTLVLSILGLAVIVLGYYKWGKGFSGLIQYRINLANKAKARGDYKEAKKQMDIALRMTKTVIKKHKEGKYKK